MRPTHYFLSSIGTHVTIAASCPATALQASVSFITLSVNRLFLGFVIPMLPLARKGRPTLSLSTSEATDSLWGQLSVENWALLRHRCGWFRHVTSTCCNRRYARRWSTEHVCPIGIEDDFLLCHELGSQAIRIWFCVFRMY